MEIALKKRWQRLARPLRFGVVGASGVVVNTAILWALARELHLAVPLASAIATEAAILSNFALNDRWTFRGATSERLLGRRLLRFNGVALGGLAITTGLLTLLTSSTRLHLLLANLLAVAAATVWNYVVNSRWTWGSQGSGVRDQGSGVRSELAVVDDSSSVVRHPSSVVGEEVAA